MEPKSYRRTATGKYKSYYYAKIALHNFEMEVKTLANMTKAIADDNSLEVLVDHASKARGVREAVSWLIENDNDFAAKMSKTIIPIPKRSPAQQTKQSLSLNYTPNSFFDPAGLSAAARKAGAFDNPLRW